MPDDILNQGITLDDDVVVGDDDDTATYTLPVEDEVEEPPHKARPVEPSEDVEDPEMDDPDEMDEGGLDE
ncbi:MAG: hypothetical protein AAB458_02630 [Patescibacteria group bacterium]